MRIISLVLILSATLVLAACQNTVEGFGRDMQKSGQAIQKAAN